MASSARVTVRSGQINLVNAHVGALTDDQKSWPTGPDQLDLDGFRYDAITGASIKAQDRLDWLARGSTVYGIFTPQPYTHFAKVLYATGHAGEARLILIARERRLADVRWQSGLAAYRAARKGDTSSDVRTLWLAMWGARLWGNLIRRVAGYGYAPQYALYWSLAVLIFGTLWFFIAWRAGAMVPNSAIILTSPDWVAAMQAAPWAPGPNWADNAASAKHYETFYALPYAADVFLPIVDLGQESAWSETTMSNFGLASRCMAWALQIAGWLITSIGLATVPGLLQRDRD